MGSLVSQLIGLIAFGIRIYTFIIIARAIISWVQPNPYNPIVQLLYKLTEPVLFPIRKSLAKYMGGVGIDFSPIVAILLLNVLMRLVVWVLLPLA
jgi:YggT family protein